MEIVDRDGWYRAGGGNEPLRMIRRSLLTDDMTQDTSTNWVLLGHAKGGQKLFIGPQTTPSFHLKAWTFSWSPARANCG